MKTDVVRRAKCYALGNKTRPNDKRWPPADGGALRIKANRSRTKREGLEKKIYQK